MLSKSDGRDGKKRGAYAVDVVRKLLSLILVDGVAHVGIRAFDGDFTSPGGQDGGFGLCSELDVELGGGDEGRI